MTRTSAATTQKVTKIRPESTVAVDAEIRRISPVEAGKMLEANVVNRRLRPQLVDAYRRDMVEGRWRMTGEPIQFSRTGKLLNGQHRLSALAGADVDGVDLLVITGLADEAQAMMDQNAPRSVVDALKIAHGDIKNITIVAGLSRWCVAHPEPGLPNMAGNFGSKISAAESIAYYDEHTEEIQEAAKQASGINAHLPGSVTGLAYSWLHVHRADPAACNEFFGAIVDLSFDFKEDARKAVLRALQRIAADPTIKNGSRSSAIMLISVVTRGFNAWHRGETLPTIAISTGKGIIPPVTPV